MEHTNPPPVIRKEERAIRVALVLLSVTTLVLLVFLVRDYQAFHHARISRVHTPLTVNDLGIIQSWMTFDYVNRIFALPPDALKTALSITDTHYPHVRVGTLVQNTQNAVRAYLTKTK